MADGQRNGGLPDHLERYLGFIAGGVQAKREDGADLPFQVVRHVPRPGDTAASYSTLGLSRHRLTQKRGSPIRQELLAHVAGEVNAYSWLSVLGEEALDRHCAYPRGAVTGPRHPVAPGSRLTGFYFTAPGFWDDELAVFDDDDGQIFLVLALPVTTSEQAFVATHGWRRFEDLLEASNLDVTDVHRQQVPGVH